MIDRSFIGHALPSFTVKAGQRALDAFARATSQPSAVFFDPDAALSRKLPACPLPPTYLFCMEMEGPDPAGMRRLLGIDIARVLHGEQRFEYHAVTFVEDVLLFEPVILDIYDKKNGALEFVVRQTTVRRPDGQRAATLVNTTVVRNG